ncbi:MAG: hypothetical protein R2806_10385 [Saprospiraceae bacterium]
MTHANVQVITGSCHEFGNALEEPDIVVSKIIENVKDEREKFLWPTCSVIPGSALQSGQTKRS